MDGNLMKSLICFLAGIALASLFVMPASATCTGLFLANSVCVNDSASPALPTPSTTLPSGLTIPSPNLTGTVEVGGNAMAFPSVPAAIVSQAQLSVVNAVVAGVDNTGATDISAALNALIAGLPAAGGEIDLNPGTYKVVAGTIAIGNGSGGGPTQSTQHGVKLKCLAAGAVGSPNQVSTGSPCVILSSFAGPAITVKGMWNGWELDDVAIVAATTNSAAGGLEVLAGVGGVTNDLQISGFYGTSLLETSGPSNGSGFNSYNRTSITLPSGAASAVGISMKGDAAVSDVFGDVFNATWITTNNTGQTSIYIGSADSERFFGTFISNIAGATNAIVFDYSAANNGSWPANVIFDGIDTSSSHVGSVTNVGTPPTGDSIFNNSIYGLSKGNGASCPILANLVCDSGYTHTGNWTTTGEVTTSELTLSPFSGSPIAESILNNANWGFYLWPAAGASLGDFVVENAAANLGLFSITDAGAVNWGAFGAGVLQTDSSGNMTAGTLATVPGQTTGGFANAGKVGEHKAISGSVTATVSGTVYQVASVSLTPGVWEVWGTLRTVPGSGTTTTQLSGAFSAATASLTAVSSDIAMSMNLPTVTNAYDYFPIGNTILIVSTTTTYYMNASEAWGTAAPTLSITGAAWRVQ
jgi:hypothetical protein